MIKIKRRKNPKEDYEDKIVKWDDEITNDQTKQEYYLTINNVLNNVLLDLNNFKAIDLQQGFKSTYLLKEQIIPDNIFTIYETKNNKNLAAVNLAFRYDFHLIKVYSKLKNQKNWRFEFSANCFVSSYVEKQVCRYNLERKLRSLLREFFPSFSAAYYE